MQQHQSQTWNNGLGNSSLLHRGQVSAHTAPIKVDTITWNTGKEPLMKGMSVEKEMQNVLPSGDTRVKIIPYSSLEQDVIYNPMGSVRDVGQVIAFHNNVRECISEKDRKRHVFVTTDNKTYFNINKAQERQSMLDKG